MYFNIYISAHSVLQRDAFLLRDRVKSRDNWTLTKVAKIYDAVNCGPVIDNAKTRISRAWMCYVHLGRTHGDGRTNS